MSQSTGTEDWLKYNVDVLVITNGISSLRHHTSIRVFQKLNLLQTCPTFSKHESIQIPNRLFPLWWNKQESNESFKALPTTFCFAVVIGAASLSHAWCRVRFRTARSPSGWRSGAVVSAGRTHTRARPTSPSGDRATSRPSKRSASTCGSAAMDIQASTASRVIILQ